jgi:sucrose-6-phosphate hydrolase SacC (GH32 family)
LGGKVFSPLLESPVRASSNSLVLKPGVGEHALAHWKGAPKDLFLSTEITMDEGSQLTLYFRSNEKIDDSYILRFDSVNSKISFRHWTGWNRNSPMNARSMEIPKDRSFKLHVMLHGDVFEAFVDDRIAISSRVQIPKGSLAISARDGHAELKRFRITHLSGDTVPSTK